MRAMITVIISVERRRMGSIEKGVGLGTSLG